MKIRKLTAARLAVLAGVTFVASLHAAPVSVSNAAYAASFVRDCRSLGNLGNVPDRCEVNGDFSQAPGVSTLKEIQETLVLGGTATSAQATNPLGIVGGQATRSNIDASGAAGQLVLKQGAFADEYARVSGHSLGLQSFLYDGTGSNRLTISNTLTFTSNVAPSADLMAPIADPTVYGRARVSVFSMLVDALTYDTGIGFSSLVQTTGFKDAAATTAGGDYRLDAEWESVGFSAGETVFVDIALEVDRYYFVESYLGLWALFGGEIDSTNSFVSQLGTTVDDGGSPVFLPGLAATGLTPSAGSDTPLVIVTAVGTVAEPGTLAMGMLSLALLVWSRARRGSVSAD